MLEWLGEGKAGAFIKCILETKGMFALNLAQMKETYVETLEPFSVKFALKSVFSPQCQNEKAKRLSASI